MPHKLGLHWQKTHYNQIEDLDHIRRMGYLSYTLFGDGAWDNKAFCESFLPATLPDAIFLLRDHPLSEQKAEAIDHPKEVGIRHGKEWVQKWREGRIHLPPQRCYMLGLNEFDTNQYQIQNDVYTTWFADVLGSEGYFPAGWSFGVGHPSTYDLDPKKPPNWEYYKQSAEAIIQAKGIAAVHEYWLPTNYNWGNWLGRYLEHCPYDIKYVIKESFYDSGLEARFPNMGYQWYIDEGNPAQVNHFLAEINGAVSRMSRDHRFHSLQGFTYDFAQPWASFDIRPIRHYFEAFNWTLASEQEKTRLPVIGNAPKSGNHTVLGLPLSGPFQVTQRFGENPEDYKRFNIPGHNGVDYGPVARDSSALAMADGVVQWVGEDPDYGKYVRVFHQQLGFHAFYAHLESFSVNNGQTVKQGARIGMVGTTGNSTGVHLHLEFRLANPDGSYKEGQYGYGKGRVDPDTVISILNYA